MAGWSDDGRRGGGDGAPNPYQEIPSYDHGGGAPGPVWDEPTNPSVIPSGPQLPIEQLGSWLERSWNLLTVGVKDLVLVQLLVLVLILATGGLLAGPMLAGYYRYAIKRTRGASGDFNDLFSALSTSLQSTFLVGIAMVGVLLSSAAILAVLDLIVGQVPVIGIVLRAAVDLSGMILIAAAFGFFSLMLPLIHEKGHTPTRALDVCLTMLISDGGRAGLFGAVVGGAPMIGGLMCGVGLLLGGPLGILTAAQAFRATFLAEGKSNPAVLR